jgi:hypothetical protein
VVSNAFVRCRVTAYVCIIQTENINNSILSDTCTYNALRMLPSVPNATLKICTLPFPASNNKAYYTLTAPRAPNPPTWIVKVEEAEMDFEVSSSPVPLF